MAIKSINSSDQLNKLLNNQKNVFDKLSSGKRINKASDDPAGLAIANNLEAIIKTLEQAGRNVSDTVSAAQIADGSLNQITEIGTRLQELATQASNGTLSDEQRGALQQEFSSLTQEIQRISQTTEFNGKNLLDGSDITAQVGKDSDPNSQVTLEGVDISSAVSNVAAQDISTQEGAQNALGAIESFVSAATSARGTLGAGTQRLDAAANSIASEKVESTAAQSRIRDADIAELTAQKVKNDILIQANTAVNAQANLSAKVVASLLS